MKGIDVSHWNGLIDWKSVRASGVEFAYIKATEGSGYVDSRFAGNWQAAAGMIRQYKTSRRR